MSALADTTNTSSQEECKKDIEAVEKPAETETPVEAATKPTEEVVVPETVADENKVEDKKEETATSEKVDESSTVKEVEQSTEEKKTTEAEENAPMEEETAEKISPEETKKKMNENLVAGRRFMKLNEFNQATEALSLAAELAAEFFGEGHLDTFETHFLYGKALLELAKAEEVVLANALTDIPKAEEGQENADDTVVENPDNVPEKERAEIKQQVGEALGVVPEEPEAIAEETTEAMADEEVKEGDKDEEAKETETAVAEDVEMETVEEKEGDEPEAEKAEESGDEDDDEPMKLAWEILETCRNMCHNHIKDLEASTIVDSDSVKTWKLNHAEVLTSLGEHGLADSKHEQAQNDLSEALKIQSSLMEATSRVIANTTHLLAKAFGSDSLFDKAAELYGDSKNILTAKLEELKKELEEASEEKKADIQSEIKELEEVIPDLEALIVDARASHEVAEKLKEVAKKELESAAAQIEKMAGEEVKDISDMVRRSSKRPAEGESQEEVKKRKSEDGTPMDEKAEETDAATAPITQE